MLPKFIRLSGLLLIMILLLTSCNLLQGAAGTQAVQDPAVFFTQAAETMSVEMTINALSALQENPTSTELPPATDTPEPVNTEQPVEVVPTLELATSTVMPTLAPETPMLHVTEDTNCRAGPSRVYRVEGYVTTDLVLPVRGVNEGRSWWWVDNPTYPDYHCWVSKWTSEVEGDTSLVPVYRDPWTPTPGVANITANIYNYTDYVEGKCPLELSFNVYITSDKATTIGYRWLKKGSVIGEHGWITLPANGSRVLNYTFHPVSSSNNKIRFQIIYPFNEIMDGAHYIVNCNNK